MFTKAQNQRGAMAHQVQESVAGLANVLLREGKVAEAAALLKQVIDHPATAHNARQSAQQQLTDIPAYP